tara:strand:+ start:144 stop:278 length:135 start_codon:yes stop_codon:yes gene_type:complete
MNREAMRKLIQLIFDFIEIDYSMKKRHSVLANYALKDLSSKKIT